MKNSKLLVLSFLFISFLTCAKEGSIGLSADVSVSGLFSHKLEEFKISAIKPDSAAQESGLKVGDIVTAIEGCAIPGCPPDEAKKLMDRESGEILTLTVNRGEVLGIPIEIHVK